MPNTETDRETHDGRKMRCPMDKCIGRVDVEICPQYGLGQEDIESCAKYCLGRHNVESCYQ